MKTINIIILTLLFTSCIRMGYETGSGNVVTEYRDLPYFNKVKVTDGLDVKIEQGSKAKVVVNADDNLIDLIKTEVENDQLNIYIEKMFIRSKNIEVLLTVNDLEELEASAGSSVKGQNPIRGSNLKVKAHAGSLLDLNLDVDQFEFNASSGSNSKLGGITKNMLVKTSSGANLDAYDLVADLAEIKSSSGSNVKIQVRKEILADISSGGNVTCKGEPEIKNINKSSGGNFSNR